MLTTINIAIITSKFNPIVTQKLLEGAEQRLKELCPDHKKIIISVPGAVEIPLVAQRLARAKKFDAIIALGAVIRGETNHYDYVCQQVSQGCQTVALENDIPVIFGILTTETQAQAFDRVGGTHGHKGKEAVDAAYEMISILKELT